MKKYHQYAVLHMLFTSIFTRFVLNCHQILYSLCFTDLLSDCATVVHCIDVRAEVACIKSWIIVSWGMWH